MKVSEESVREVKPPLRAPPSARPLGARLAWRSPGKSDSGIRQITMEALLYRNGKHDRESSSCLRVEWSGCFYNRANTFLHRIRYPYREHLIPVRTNGAGALLPGSYFSSKVLAFDALLWLHDFLEDVRLAKVLDDVIF